jgi:DNA-binding transcriptional MerR regulator
MSTGTDHQSIGEVLGALRDEFPDVTISKIRFLESQGLIDPERTPSGYRKFRDGDVARLRWILHQQKDNFLPLKVIKSRLDEAGPDALPADVDAEPESSTKDETSARATGSRAAKSKRASRAKPKKAAARATKSSTSRRDPAPAPTFEFPTLPLEPDGSQDDDLRALTTGASFTRKELATAAGLTPSQLDELEQYGMVVPAAGSGERVIFSEESLVVAKLAGEFAGHGIGPRHLRMFRSFAEREAGLYDQVIAPRLRRKNPEARAQAREDLVDLARLGRALRAALLREAAAGLLAD